MFAWIRKLFASDAPAERQVAEVSTEKPAKKEPVPYDPFLLTETLLAWRVAVGVQCERYRTENEQMRRHKADCRKRLVDLCKDESSCDRATAKGILRYRELAEERKSLESAIWGDAAHDCEWRTEQRRQREWSMLEKEFHDKEHKRIFDEGENLHERPGTRLVRFQGRMFSCRFWREGEEVGIHKVFGDIAEFERPELEFLARKESEECPVASD